MMHAEKMQDEELIRCRKLGHNLNFSYCRKEELGQPCRSILDCWFSRINILEYLNNQFGITFLREFLEKTKKDKMSSIIEIVERATKEDKEEEKGK